MRACVVRPQPTQFAVDRRLCVGAAGADAWPRSNVTPEPGSHRRHGFRSFLIPDHARSLQSHTDHSLAGALDRPAADLEPAGAVGGIVHARLMRGEEAQGGRHPLAPGAIRRKRRQHVGHPPIPQRIELLAHPRQAQVAHCANDRRRRLPHLLTGVLPIQDVGRLRELFRSQIPHPVRPIAQHDDLGLVGHPTLAGFRPQLPAERCGISQRRKRALS